MPALLAGFLVAFLQSMTLFGTPAILALPGGRRYDDHQDLEPVPVSAAARTRGRGVAAAAAHHRVLLRAQAAIMGRRGYSVIGGKSAAARA